MKLSAKQGLTTWFESLSLRGIGAMAAGWVLLFAVLYTIVPRLTNMGTLHTSSGDASGFGIALYVSLATAVSLGYSDAYPVGILRLLAGIEVVGGLVIAGLAVNSLVALPSRQTRRAIKFCSGWWLEWISVSKRRHFFSITCMTADGNMLRKRGFNHDPDGSMDKTQYDGELITAYFPLLMSVYENDNQSTEYSEGILKFQMEQDGRGVFRSHLGASYDARHGKRDTIRGRRIEDAVFVAKAERGNLTREDVESLVARAFPSATFGRDGMQK